MDSYAYASFSSNSDRLIASRSNRVKNKAPAEVQITAEQLLREASERSEPAFRQTPQKKGHDADVLHESTDQLHTKRKSFEDAIRRNRNSIGTWLKYAAWEERLGERHRARSIYERVLEVEYRNTVIWLKYAEMEMKAGNIQHTRNIWNRAVSLLPRVDQFWYKWAYFEEKLGNVEGARAIFERWIEGWRPPPTAFQSYIKLETRYKESEKVRAIYQRMIKRFSDNSEVWIETAKWEESIGAFDKARSIYDEAINALGSQAAPKLFTSFAKFEIRRGDYDKARTVFHHALKILPIELSGPLFSRYIQFEKQFGTAEDVERIVLEGRIRTYEDELSKNPHSYDVWFERLWLEQELCKMRSFFDDSSSCSNASNISFNATSILIPHTSSSVQQIFERAISNIPLSLNKQYWRRYIYLWIYYSLWKELEMSSIEEAIVILEKAINCIPVEAGWSFSKLWTLLSKALIRIGNLSRARKILGTAIGKHPKRSLFVTYISIEKKLKEFDRVRKLYEKWIIWRPDSQEAWLQWSALEKALGDIERAKALLMLGIESCSSPVTLMSEALSLSSDSNDDVLFLLEKWISISPQDTQPWLRLCTLNPSYWNKALSHFEELGDIPLSSLAQIIDAYIAFEESEERPVVWLQRKRPTFDIQTKTWAPSNDTELEQNQIASKLQEQESSAALRLLEVARKWRKGETFYGEDSPSNADIMEDDDRPTNISKRFLQSPSSQDEEDLDY